MIDISTEFSNRKNKICVDKKKNQNTSLVIGNSKLELNSVVRIR